MFTLDNYNVVDLSIRINATYEKTNSDRPYVISESLLADGLFKHEVSTHSHVGTHVELPRHFTKGGKTLDDYPLSKFYGYGLLLDIKQEYITAEYMEELTKEKDLKDRIILFKNSYSETVLPKLKVEASEWMVKKGVSIIGFEDGKGGINIGETEEIGHKNHEIMLMNDILMIEFVDGLNKISKEEFFVFALPLNILNVDSLGIRLVAIEDK